MIDCSAVSDTSGNNRLPVNPDTLWLRLLGKGKTQQQAINEVIAFDDRDPRRSSILKLLANWKISIEITGQVSEEQELMMALSQAYLEWEQQTEQRGLEKGLQQGEQSLILRLLKRRIGELSPAILQQIQGLSLVQLESLGEALLDFTSADDLVEWMQRNA
jgi:predicted transposase YdaD